MDRGTAICEELKKAGINHLVWLPCSATRFISRAALDDPDIKTVQVCRESEAVAILVGLHLGGKRGALMAENNGIYESGNVLRWLCSMPIPMLLLVGWPEGRMPKYGIERLPGSELAPVDPPHVDITKPFLDFYGINQHLVDTDEDVSKVATACEEAWNTRRPVALVVTRGDGFIAGT